jgi:hypothetical protein
MPSTAVFVDLARAAFGTLILSVPHVCSSCLFHPTRHSRNLQISESIIRNFAMPRPETASSVLQDRQRQSISLRAFHQTLKRPLLELQETP